MKRLFTNATFVTMVDEFDTADALLVDDEGRIDRKSTRLNSSHT